MKNPLLLGLLVLFFLPPLASAQSDNAKAAYERQNLLALTTMADAGDPVAQNKLGLMYGRGLGVPKDDAIAASWYRKAADQEYAIAQYNLGVMYYYGRGVTQDRVAAFSWYRKAADQGYVSAQIKVGNMYRRGSGVEENHVEAMRWYRLAADNGSSDGKKLVGDMYRSTPTKDRSARDWKYVEAMRWYRKAADQGNSDAEIAIGEMYLFGIGGVAKDYAMALSWAQKAADKGNLDAQTLIANVASSRRKAAAAEAERDGQVRISFNYRGRTITVEKKDRSGIINSCLDLFISKFNPKIILAGKSVNLSYGRYRIQNGFQQQQYVLYNINGILGNNKIAWCAHKNRIAFSVQFNEPFYRD